MTSHLYLFGAFFLSLNAVFFFCAEGWSSTRIQIYAVRPKQEFSFSTSSSSSSPRSSSLTLLAAAAAAAAAANNELPSLYQEQEKLLISRGELEGQLMADTYIMPLETHVVKGAGSGGGFGSGKGAGGGGSSRTTSSSLKTQAKAYAKVLRQQGVVRMDNILSAETADAMRAFLYNMRREAEILVREGKCKPMDVFADVLLKTNRCDMPVPLGSNLVATALQQALIQSPVGETMAQLLGKDAVLYELSCLMSDPGSQRQVMHPDTPCNSDEEQAVLYTCFIALQDITADMGPTTWLPNTHTRAMHAQFRDDTVSKETGKSPKDVLLQTQPAVLGLLPKGSCGIYDSRLLHCGGANQSVDKSRALFYFSFKNPKIGYAGNPGSIRKELTGLQSLTLQDLLDDLKLFSKGKPTARLLTAY